MVAQVTPLPLSLGPAIVVAPFAINEAFPGIPGVQSPTLMIQGVLGELAL